MTFLFFLIGISVLGIGVVFWLLKKETSETTHHDLMQPLTAEQFGAREEMEEDEKPPSLAQPQQEMPAGKEEPPVLTIPDNVKASLPPEKEEPSPEEKPPEPGPKSLLDESFQSAQPKSGKEKTSLFAKLPFIRKFIKPKISFDSMEAREEDDDSTPLQHVAPPKNPLAKILESITSIVQRNPKLDLSDMETGQTAQETKPRKSLIDKLVNLIKFPKKKKKVSIDPSSDFVSLEDSLNINLNQTTEELPEINISEESQEKTQAKDKKTDKTPQIHKFENQLKDLKEKYQNLEKLYDQKSSKLEKIQTSLENELNNRKEFNKVKDLMEKELKDLKDKTRESQSDLKKVTDENEGYKKRINQLEGKLTSLEKLLEEKNQEKEKLSEAASPEQMPEEPQEEPEKPSPEQEASTATLAPLIKENEIEESKGEETSKEESAAAEEPREPENPEETLNASDDDVIVNLDSTSSQPPSENKIEEQDVTKNEGETKQLDQEDAAPKEEEPQETQEEPASTGEEEQKKAGIEKSVEKKEDLGSEIEKMLSAKDDAPKEEKPKETQDKPQTNKDE